MSMSTSLVTRVMDALLDCLSDENVEVREMASKMLSGVVRCSQRQSIIPLRVGHFRRRTCTLTFVLTVCSLIGPVRETCEEDQVAFSSRSIVRRCSADPAFCYLGIMRPH